MECLDPLFSKSPFRFARGNAFLPKARDSRPDGWTDGRALWNELFTSARRVRHPVGHSWTSQKPRAAPRTSASAVAQED